MRSKLLEVREESCQVLWKDCSNSAGNLRESLDLSFPKKRGKNVSFPKRGEKKTKKNSSKKAQHGVKHEMT